MKTFKRFIPGLTRRWVGVVALLLSSGAVAVPQSSQAASVVATTRVPAATEQVVAQADARAALFDVQSGKSASCTCNQQYGVRYSVQRLEVVGGIEAFPTAMNNRGWVVGYSHAFSRVIPTLWIGGRAFDLGSLGGNVGYAYDINDAGQVVGFSTDAFNGVMRAFVWYRGQITALASLGGDTASYTVARGINSAGVIAGESAVPGGLSVRAVLWSNGVPRALESLGGSLSSANRINDRGYSVGISNLPDATLHAALWTPQGDIVDLGAQSVALDNNNSGRIVGYSFGNGLPFKPLKWYRRVRTVLPTLGGENGIAFEINEKDQAVGYSQTATGLVRATIWFGNTPVQIDTLLDDENNGLVIDEAYAINDKGQIAAIRRLPNNRVEPLLLTPRRCDDM